MVNMTTQANVYRTRDQDHDKVNNPDTFLGPETTVQQSDYSHAFCMVVMDMKARTMSLAHGRVMKTTFEPLKDNTDTCPRASVNNQKNNHRP